MSDLLQLIQEQTSKSTRLSQAEIKAIINADESVLHDPFLLKNMDKLIDQLHQVHQRQTEDPSALVIIDTDYDTDGVMSAAVLSARLNVLGFNYRIYIPSMDDGYGLSEKAVDDMLVQFNSNGFHIDTILTADNGTNAIAGVQHAKDNGIHVLVSDHHLGRDQYSNADVIVNPNQRDDEYPFKGNARATVAWKVLMAYSQQYAPEQIQYIKDLIVFAGIANVSDIMPIRDENHYMVKQSVNEMRRLLEIADEYPMGDGIYQLVKNTPYPMYNAIFHRLFDMMIDLQEQKNAKRAEQGKKPIPLARNEEMISWYLSPMMNAPRRIHATAKEAFLSILDNHSHTRHENIHEMLTMNAEKSLYRDKILKDLPWDKIEQEERTVVIANTQHGIAGLIARQITSKTRHASIVLAESQDNDKTMLSPADLHYDPAGSARSVADQPLNVIMARIAEAYPAMVVGGRGHAMAAGYQIAKDQLKAFIVLFNKVARDLRKEIQAEIQKEIDNGEREVPIANELRFANHSGFSLDGIPYYDYRTDNNFAEHLLELNNYFDSLRPFGTDFNIQTQLSFDLNLAEITKPEYQLDLDFWKTFKFTINGVEVLTFNTELAEYVKKNLREDNQITIPVQVELGLNTFRGVTKPQLIIQ